MKITYSVAVFAVALALGGCMSTEVAKVETTGEEHVVVRDYGWRLFNWLPVFRRDITHEAVQTEMLDCAAKRHKRAEDLVFDDYQTVMLEIPLIGFTIPIPYLLTYEEIQLSGVLR